MVHKIDTVLFDKTDIPKSSNSFELNNVSVNSVLPK